jgi:hypothetical protein
MDLKGSEALLRGNVPVGLSNRGARAPRALGNSLDADGWFCPGPAVLSGMRNRGCK